MLMALAVSVFSLALSLQRELSAGKIDPRVEWMGESSSTRTFR
jgi:hypothetical protein